MKYNKINKIKKLIKFYNTSIEKYSLLKFYLFF